MHINISMHILLCVLFLCFAGIHLYKIHVSVEAPPPRDRLSHFCRVSLSSFISKALNFKALLPLTSFPLFSPSLHPSPPPPIFFSPAVFSLVALIISRDDESNPHPSLNIVCSLLNVSFGNVRVIFCCFNLWQGYQLDKDTMGLTSLSAPAIRVLDRVQVRIQVRVELNLNL